MVDNQHKKIKGYRDLSDQEIQQMNECKKLGSDCDQLINKLFEQESADSRWVSIGKTHLQQGIMALVRSIDKPESF